MKFALLVFTLVLGCAQMDAAVSDRFLNALEQVESRGNPRAVGDNGRALGALQIWDVVIQDVNRVYRTSYVHHDAFDRSKARDIARKYLAIYATPKRLGRQPTLEDYARIWNGGPRGHLKPATAAYWSKVQRALQS